MSHVRTAIPLAAFAVVLAALAVLLPLPTEAKNCCCKTDASDCIEVPVGPCTPDYPDPKLVADTESCSYAQDNTKKSGILAILGGELIPSNCRSGAQTAENPCTLNDLLIIFANLAKLMLGLLGTAAFAMFVYGGFVFLTSAGNQEQVTKGKRVVTNAALGILVVLVSWNAINLVVVLLSKGRGGLGQIGEIFSNQWNRGP